MKPKPLKHFSELKEGDIIRHVAGGRPKVITAKYGSFCIATSTQAIMNPSEWVKIERNEVPKKMQDHIDRVNERDKAEMDEEEKDDRGIPVCKRCGRIALGIISAASECEKGGSHVF